MPVPELLRRNINEMATVRASAKVDVAMHYDVPRSPFGPFLIMAYAISIRLSKKRLKAFP